MSNNYEIIPKPAKPPKDWTDIYSDLEVKAPDKALYYIVAVPCLLVLLVLGFFAFLASNWIFFVIVVVLAGSFAASILSSRAVANEYGLYATWIYETIQPTSEKLKVTVKITSEDGIRHWKAEIIDPQGQEEIYDIKTISPNTNLGAKLAEEVQEAKIYRDPINQQCVVAVVGNIIVWLWEYTPY